MFAWNRLTFLFVTVVAAVGAVLCHGCADFKSGIAGAFEESKRGNIEKDDISKYATVTIGTQQWIKRNLDIDVGENRCYKDQSSYCGTYGRLYDWPTATKICPVGWHLPSTKEWNVLIQYAGGSSVAGSKLKSRSGWNNYFSRSGNGSDDFGFTALPGGFYYSTDEEFINIGDSGCWWTDEPGFNFWMEGNEKVSGSKWGKKDGCSVRCIKG